MIAEIVNKSGMRCANCGKVPPSWYVASCPSSCGFTLAACGGCASRDSIETGLAEHQKKCGAQDAMSGLESSLQGLVGAMHSRPAESITRKAANLGAQLGEARGERGRQIGAVAGAVVGAVADHTLGRPEMAPAIRAVKGIIGVAGVVRDVLNKKT